MKIEMRHNYYRYFKFPITGDGGYAKYANGAIITHYPHIFYHTHKEYGRPAEKKNISGDIGLAAVVGDYFV